MRKIVTIILAIVMMVTGMIASGNNAIKAEAARVEDSRVIYTVSDIVATSKYYIDRDYYRVVMSVDGGAVCVVYHGRLERGGILHGKMLYADVVDFYVDDFLRGYHVEVPEN